MIKQKTISISKLSTIRMVAGQEKNYSKVIHDGILKEWVGIGWICLRNATKQDYKRYPKVTRKK